MKLRYTLIAPCLLIVNVANAQVSAPVAAPQATALPEVAMPTMAPAGELPAAPPETTATDLAQPVATSLVEAPTPYSFGEVPFSLFYSPAQLDKMRKVLTIYESAKRNNSAAPIEVVEEELDIPAQPEAIKIVEPALYPSFTLRSIVYRDPRDWTVWIGDQRITPKTNTGDQEIRVLGLTASAGQFLWKPAYGSALAQRKQANAFVDSKAVAHKITKPNTAQLDTATGQVTFTLRPNQTFAAGYMATFEGQMPAVTMPQLTADQAALDNAATLSQGPDDVNKAAPANNSSLQQLNNSVPGSAVNTETLDTLLRQQQNMQQFAPPGAKSQAQ